MQQLKNERKEKILTAKIITSYESMILIRLALKIVKVQRIRFKFKREQRDGTLFSTFFLSLTTIEIRNFL